MAERNEKVYERVVEELGKNPDMGSKELFGIAQAMDKSISRYTMQQFHARYYLPAKRGFRPGASTDVKQPRSGRRGRGRARRQETTQATQDSGAEASRPRRRRLPRLRGTSQNGTDRDRIRGLLLQFAQELTDAESRSSLVKVLGRVDSYVDRIAESAGS